MTSELHDLYQELILDHDKQPRNRHPLAGADHKAEGHNPLCGDRVTVSLKLDDDRVSDIAFEGHGCAISTASASMMTERSRARPSSRPASCSRNSTTGNRPAEDAEAGPELGKLEVFGGVSQYPVRVKSPRWRGIRSKRPWSSKRRCVDGMRERRRDGACERWREPTAGRPRSPSLTLSISHTGN